MKNEIILIFLIVVFLFVPVNVFAVDFVDSSGHTPSWAKGNGYHTVLVKCTQISGDFSRDADWCLEWMAYVLDQGVENFPESTSEVSSNVKINSNDLVQGELYFGSLTKYLPPNSSYEKSVNPDLEFQPNPNLEGWIIGAPFSLPSKTTAKYMGLSNNVAQGIFVQDIYGKNSIVIGIIILEFENDVKANDIFKSKKLENQNEINSQSTMKDIEGVYNVYFEDCYGYLQNYELSDESAKLVCIKDRYIVSVTSNQINGHVTDKYFDDVFPDEVVSKISGKIGKNIDDAIQKITDRHSGGVTISDEKSCIALIKGSEWNPTSNSCIVKFLSVESGETLTISRDTRVIAAEGTIRNKGTINVLGEIMNFGTLENFGTINVLLSIVNEGDIINKGTITINSDGGIYNFDTGTLNNFGTITNNNYFVNFGEINNNCNAVISGKPIGNRFGTGDNPINNISCVVSEKVTPKPEIQSSSKPEIVSEVEEKGGGCLIATATYGSELAPQVQQLRELRDNSLLQTASGTSFMSSFNDFYYSFSPQIADWERESPAFKEMVKVTLTPMITSLSILNYVDMDSEVSVLGYGISLILLNVGMYFVAPGIVIHSIRTRL